MTGFILLSTLIIALISFFLKKWNCGATILIALIIICLAGMRVGGFDYIEYVYMIESLQDNTSAELDMTTRLFIAKDPMMLAIVDLCSFVNGKESWPVFLSFAFIGIATKTIAAFTLKRYSVIFISAYAILLSHALDFAAIRSSLAIGFILLAFANKDNIKFNLTFWILAIASHISATIFLIGLLPSKFLTSRKSIIVLLLISAPISYILSSQIWSIERAVDFVNNQGNLTAIFFPVATIFIFLAQIFSSNPVKNNIYRVISIGLGTSLGLSIPAVTISARLLEMCWCFLLFAIFKDASQANFNLGRKYAFLCACTFFLLLCFSLFFRPSFLALFTDITYNLS